MFLFYPINQLATPFITCQLSVSVLPDQSARSNVPTPPHVKSTSLLVTRGIHLLAWSRGLYATRTPLLYQSPIKSTKKKNKTISTFRSQLSSFSLSRYFSFLYGYDHVRLVPQISRFTLFIFFFSDLISLNPCQCYTVWSDWFIKRSEMKFSHSFSASEQRVTELFYGCIQICLFSFV